MVLEFVIVASGSIGIVGSVILLHLHFFDDRFPGRVVTGSPLPLFMQTDPPIGQYFGCRDTSPGHEFTPIIDLVIAHIDPAFRAHDAQKMTPYNPPSGVTASQDVAFLVVMKSNVRCHFTIFSVVNRIEYTVVVIDHSTKISG